MKKQQILYNNHYGTARLCNTTTKNLNNDKSTKTNNITANELNEKCKLLEIIDQYSLIFQTMGGKSIWCTHPSSHSFTKLSLNKTYNINACERMSILGQSITKNGRYRCLGHLKTTMELTQYLDIETGHNIISEASVGCENKIPKGEKCDIDYAKNYQHMHTKILVDDSNSNGDSATDIFSIVNRWGKYDWLSINKNNDKIILISHSIKNIIRKYDVGNKYKLTALKKYMIKKIIPIDENVVGKKTMFNNLLVSYTGLTEHRSLNIYKNDNTGEDALVFDMFLHTSKDITSELLNGNNKLTAEVYDSYSLMSENICIDSVSKKYKIVRVINNGAIICKNMNDNSCFAVNLRNPVYNLYDQLGNFIKINDNDLLNSYAMTNISLIYDKEDVSIENTNDVFKIISISQIAKQYWTNYRIVKAIDNTNRTVVFLSSVNNINYEMTQPLVGKSVKIDYLKCCYIDLLDIQ